jgi:hypothetical protein
MQCNKGGGYNSFSRRCVLRPDACLSLLQYPRTVWGVVSLLLYREGEWRERNADEGYFLQVRHLTLYVVDGRRPAGRAAVLLDLGGMARIHAGALHTAAGGCSPVWGSAQAQLRQYSSRGISGIRYFRLY